MFYEPPPLGITFTVAHHAYALADGYTDGYIGPVVGDVFRPPQTYPSFHWSTEPDIFGFGLLEEAVFVLDTDARAYAKTGRFWIDASTRDFSMESVPYAGFAPAIPEPATYALLLAGAPVVVFLAKRRRAKA